MERQPPHQPSYPPKSRNSWAIPYSSTKCGWVAIGGVAGATSLGSIYDYWATTWVYECVFVCYYVNCLEIHHHVPRLMAYAAAEAAGAISMNVFDGSVALQTQLPPHLLFRVVGQWRWHHGPRRRVVRIACLRLAYCYCYRRPPGGRAQIMPQTYRGIYLLSATRKCQNVSEW